MPNYKTNDPRGWCGDPSRGAALGRPSIYTDGFAGTLTVRRRLLDAGGYDENGTYFGAGAPLYWIASEGGEVDYMIRARDREDAVAATRVKYPKAEISSEFMLDDALDEFFAAYVEAALWSSMDNADPETGGEPLDANYTAEDVAPKTAAKMRATCEAFVAANRDLLAQADYPGRKTHSNMEMAGHDLWLTSTGHGAGFGDGDCEPPEVDNALHEAARKVGGMDLYVGDDGKIHS